MGVFEGRTFELRGKVVTVESAQLVVVGEDRGIAGRWIEQGPEEVPP